MTDIVERLRLYIRFEHPKDYETHIVWQAADEIERLRKLFDTIEGLPIIGGGLNDAVLIARAALGEGK